MSSHQTLDSLQRRMRAMHSLYHQAVATMDIEHVNHNERDGVLPIAFCLFHITNMIDASFMLMTGTPPIWNDEWQARVGMTINDHGKHKTVDEMVYQRIGDYEAFQDYMRAVFELSARVASHGRDRVGAGPRRSRRHDLVAVSRRHRRRHCPRNVHGLLLRRSAPRSGLRL